MSVRSFFISDFHSGSLHAFAAAWQQDLDDCQTTRCWFTVVHVGAVVAYAGPVSVQLL